MKQVWTVAALSVKIQPEACCFGVWWNTSAWTRFTMYAGVRRVMADCQREFCSKCGNKTLSRVTVSYNDDGTVQYFLSRHKTFSTRGLRVCYFLSVTCLLHSLTCAIQWLDTIGRASGQKKILAAAVIKDCSTKITRHLVKSTETVNGWPVNQKPSLVSYITCCVVSLSLAVFTVDWVYRSVVLAGAKKTGCWPLSEKDATILLLVVSSSNSAVNL